MSHNLPQSPKQRLKNRFRTRVGTLRQPGVDEYLSLTPEERMLASDNQLGYDDVLEERRDDD